MKETVANRNLVLVIDDLEANRYFFSYHLKSVGYDVIEASSGMEGLELAKMDPDLIILDVNLPDMSGHEVCATIKKDAILNRIPIIQTSANFVHTKDHVKGIECGADSYLSTPINPLIFLSTVKAWLRVRASDKLSMASLKQLEMEKELREKFVSSLSHDLRTPLTAAKLNAQLLVKNLEPESTSFKIANKIIGNIVRTDYMIKDLLDANMIKAGEKPRLNVDRCNLKNLLEEVVSDQGSIYGDVFTLQNTEIEGYWDSEALRRIIENLSSNAVKYGDKKSNVVISSSVNDNKVEIKVHNTGTPISEQDMKSLFEPFVRAATSATTHGWGLGLNLVKTFTEAHNGVVGVKSDSASGTTFMITIPQDCRPLIPVES